MKKFIGSCSDDKIGIGYILIGEEIRRVDDQFQILTDSGWVDCYDVMKLNGEVESPVFADCPSDDGVYCNKHKDPNCPK